MERIIKISQEAYQSMLMHILQYGSKGLKKSQEAFGLIYGIRTGNVIEIKEAIPTNHGPACTKVFTETDKVGFSEIDAQEAEKGYDPFGFYISHPGMGYYIAQNEIKNLLYFHNELKQDYAFAIVADHAQMENEGDYGIKAVILTDPDKGAMSDFTLLDVEIEPPKDLSLFRISKYLIEQGQKHQPYVEEKGMHIEADDSIWDAFSGGEDQHEKADQDLGPLFEALKNEIKDFENSFIKETLYELHGFGEEIINFLKKSLDVPNNNLFLLRESFEKGIVNIRKWFEDSLLDYEKKILKEFARTEEMVRSSFVHHLAVIEALIKKLNA